MEYVFGFFSCLIFGVIIAYVALFAEAFAGLLLIILIGIIWYQLGFIVALVSFFCISIGIGLGQAAQARKIGRKIFFIVLLGCAGYYFYPRIETFFSSQTNITKQENIGGKKQDVKTLKNTKESKEIQKPTKKTQDENQNEKESVWPFVLKIVKGIASLFVLIGIIQWIISRVRKRRSQAKNNSVVQQRQISTNNANMGVGIEKIVEENPCYDNLIYREKITQETIQKLKVNIVDKQKIVVHDSIGQAYKLNDKLASGGEGIVYKVDSQDLIKIYRDNKVPKYTENKLKLMLEKHIFELRKNIFAPKDIVFNNKKEFVGYLMSQARGCKLQEIFGGSDNESGIDDNEKNYVKLCVNFLETVDFLHSHRIIVGDINPNNILINEKCEMFFIDCDSFQIGNYPCPVGTDEFLPPELRGQNMNETMRSLGNEYYSISVMLFKIMCRGVHPYQAKGSSMDDNIKNSFFPYEIKGSNSKTPTKSVQYWESMSLTLREAFYHTFSKNGKHRREDSRLSPKQWLACFREYQKKL